MIEKIKTLFGRLIDYIKELGSLTPIALVTAVLPIVISTSLLALGLPIGNWLRENPNPGLFVFFLAIVTLCGLSLLPTNVIGIMSGFAFGFATGITTLMAGIVCAATLAYFIDRRIAGDRLPDTLSRHKQGKAVYDALVGQSIWRTALIIFLLRLSPAMPFALTNFLMASAKVPLPAFIGGTFFGMLPRSIAVVVVGSGLSELSLDNPDEKWLLIFGIIATIISVIVISIIARRALEKLTNDQTAPAASTEA